MVAPTLPEGFEPVRLLGVGATGQVVLGRQRELDRLVAIKLLHTGDRDANALQRLVREARTIVSLRHAAIVIAFELRPLPAGGAAMIMEYVPGGDLRRLMDSGTLRGAQAVELLTQIAEGLAHAHGQGVVHRDLKPANVLLTADGRAKIADFGLARLSRVQDAFRTVNASASGTPAYMAPEQITHPSREFPESDAYAFAVLAYEILVGSRPFPATDVAAVIDAHLNASPAAPWLVTPGFDSAVGHALLAGLSKSPGDRLTPAALVAHIGRIPPDAWDALFAARAVRAVRLSDERGLDSQTVDDHAARPAASGSQRQAAGSIRPEASTRPAPVTASPFRARRTTTRPSRRARLAIIVLACAGGVAVGLLIALLGRHG